MLSQKNMLVVALLAALFNVAVKGFYVNTFYGSPKSVNGAIVVLKSIRPHEFYGLYGTCLALNVLVASALLKTKAHMAAVVAVLMVAFDATIVGLYGMAKTNSVPQLNSTALALAIALVGVAALKMK